MKKRIITYTIMFLVFFLVQFFLTMLTGVSGRPVLNQTYKSLSFNEMLDEIPGILAVTIIVLLLGVFVLEKTKK